MFDLNFVSLLFYTFLFPVLPLFSGFCFKMHIFLISYLYFIVIFKNLNYVNVIIF